MIKLEMNLCFILICFIIETPRYLSQTAYPFPALLKLNTACTSNLYPAYVKYENNKYVAVSEQEYIKSKTPVKDVAKVSKYTKFSEKTE